MGHRASKKSLELPPLPEKLIWLTTYPGADSKKLSGERGTPTQASAMRILLAVCSSRSRLKADISGSHMLTTSYFPRCCLGHMNLPGCMGWVMHELPKTSPWILRIVLVIASYSLLSSLRLWWPARLKRLGTTDRAKRGPIKSSEREALQGGSKVKLSSWCSCQVWANWHLPSCSWLGSHSPELLPLHLKMGYSFKTWV